MKPNFEKWKYPLMNLNERYDVFMRFIQQGCNHVLEKSRNRQEEKIVQKKDLRRKLQFLVNGLG